MLEKLKFNKEDSLIRDGFILFIATMAANVLGYFYHFSAGRLLGPVNYGILGAILSLLYLVNVPVNVIQTSLAKFSSQYKAEQQEQKVNPLLRRSLKQLFIAGIIITILFFITQGWIASFFKIPKEALYFFSPLLLFSLLLPIPRGILQGLQKFPSLGINLVLEGISKLLIGVTLIFLGFGIRGAILGIVASYAFSFFFSYKPLKKYLSSNNEKISSKQIFTYAFPVFLIMLFLTSYYTFDVLLVKHFLSEQEAGFYAALSLIGKMIFFATFSLGNVMFPKVAEMHALNKENKHLLYKSLGLMVLGAIVATLAYFFLPQLIVRLLFGKQYYPIIPLVGWMGIMMSFYSLSYLLALYNLSINRSKGLLIICAFFLILEVVLLILFHTNLAQIVKTLTALMTLLFIVLFAYTRKK